MVDVHTHLDYNGDGWYPLPSLWVHVARNDAGRWLYFIIGVSWLNRALHITTYREQPGFEKSVRAAIQGLGDEYE